MGEGKFPPWRPSSLSSGSAQHWLALTDNPFRPITGLTWTFSLTSSENHPPARVASAQLNSQMKMERSWFIEAIWHIIQTYILSVSFFVVVPVVCAHHKIPSLSKEKTPNSLWVASIIPGNSFAREIRVLWVPAFKVYWHITWNMLKLW